MSNEKQCRKCLITKSIDLFNRVTTNSRKCFADGRNTYCIECSRYYLAIRKEQKGQTGAVAALEQAIMIEKWLELNPQDRWCAKGRHMVAADQMTVNTSRESGTNSRCRDCFSSHYYYSDPESVKERAKRWYYENFERANATRRAYTAALPKETRNRYRRTHYEKNKEAKAAYKQRYKVLYPDKYKEQNRQYYLKNKPQFRAWLQNRRALERQATGSFTKAQWLAKFAYFGERCYLCGNQLTDTTATVEHRIPLSRGGTNWIANIAPTCLGCNLAKNRKTEQEFRRGGVLSLAAISSRLSSTP